MDTLKLADDIEQAGFTHQQAHGLARAIANSATEGLASKHDVSELGAALRTEMAELRGETHEGFARVHEKMADVHREVGQIWWKVAVLLIAQAGAIVALIKAIP